MFDSQRKYGTKIEKSSVSTNYGIHYFDSKSGLSVGNRNFI